MYLKKKKFKKRKKKEEKIRKGKKRKKKQEKEKSQQMLFQKNPAEDRPLTQNHWPPGVKIRFQEWASEKMQALL